MGKSDVNMYNDVSKSQQWKFFPQWLPWTLLKQDFTHLSGDLYTASSRSLSDDLGVSAVLSQIVNRCYHIADQFLTQFSSIKWPVLFPCSKSSAILPLLQLIFKFVIHLCFIQRERFHSFWAAWRVVVLQQAVYNLNIHSIHCHLFVTLEILMYSKSVNIELVECLLFFAVLLSSLSFDFLSFNKFSNTSPLFTHYYGNKYGNNLENRSTLFRAKFSCRYQEEITKNRKH